MRESEDPYLKVMAFLEGKDKRAVDLGHRLEEAFDVILSNVIMTCCLLVYAIIVLMFVSPLLIGSENRVLNGVGAFMHVGAGILMLCHQLPYRSLIFDGIPMAVCARDVGIYLGSMIGFATVFLMKKPKILSNLNLVLLGSIPMALDGITQTILLLRESNNIIRLVTGFIFGFAVIAYLANRWMLKWYPKFRAEVLSTKLVILDSLLVVILVYLILAAAGQEINVTYMNSADAIKSALDLSKITTPAEVKAYYISSMTPISTLKDPYYSSHEDQVLHDIRSSDFTKKRQLLLTGVKEAPYDVENTSTKEFLFEVAENEHKFGIWAVTVLTEKSIKGYAPYLSEGHGEYFYFDALTGKLIMKRTH